MGELRIRGGVEYDPRTKRWQPIVHIWKDQAGLGEPAQEYRWRDTYATETEALEVYRVEVRPALEAMLDHAGRTPGVRAQVNRWGFLDHGTRL